MGSFVRQFVLALLAGGSIGAADAAELVREYDAGPYRAGQTPASVWTPQQFRWKELFVNGAGAGVVNAGGSGHNAWLISDASPAIPNPAYVTDFSPSEIAQAAADGWRFTTTARYVDDFGTGPNLGLSAFIGGRAYHLMLDLNNDHDLRATLYDQPSRTYTLTSGSSGTAEFHRFELKNAPGSSAVSFLFDGYVVETQWDGIGIQHVSTVQWGHSSQAGSSRGAMEFQSVNFELGPLVEAPIDYDGDGDVDGGDFLNWQRHVGAPLTVAGASAAGVEAGSVLAGMGYLPTIAAANSFVPEPAGAVLVIVGAGSMGIALRKQRKMDRQRK